MSDKSLSDKAIDIKGKQYVLVSDRVIYFNEKYPNGSIITELVSQPEDPVVVMKATVIPDQTHIEGKTYKRIFTGWSQAKWGDGFINRTSALENCETSAVGRALAMMGIGVIDSIASVDEINKANTSKPVDASLMEAKQRVYKAFKSRGVLDTETMKSAIETAVGHSEIETVEDAELVIEALEEGDK